MKLTDAGIYDFINIFKGETTKTHSTVPGGVEPRCINIPAYQRPYRWEKIYVERLLEDYYDNDENGAEYFLGAAVAVKKEIDEGIQFDMVDGQQRITTLFLLNYVRFLLRRKYILKKIEENKNRSSWQVYIDKLKENYVSLIGKNIEPFKKIKNKLDELEEDEVEGDVIAEKFLASFKEQLCIADVQSTVEETNSRTLEKNKEFFKKEKDLCLKYSRKRYDETLKEALYSVVIEEEPSTTNLKLNRICEEDTDDFLESYLVALETIMEFIWDKKTTDTKKTMERCEEAFIELDKMIENLSICVVLTEDDNDANKLFEVLNDRSLSVNDLELMKNHFFKEYCTKSTDLQEDQDERITKLDEIWTDNTFAEDTDYKKKLIAYLGTSYITCVSEIVYKDDFKLKEVLERKYSNDYNKEDHPYSYEDIWSDFNVYFAIKIILDKFDIVKNRPYPKSLDAENSGKSITYKAMHLLRALDLNGVLAALTNVIISFYVNEQGNSLCTDDFESKFTAYVGKIIDDKNYNQSDYIDVHKCAYNLWIAAIKSNGFESVKSIASNIIQNNGRNQFNSRSLELSTDDNRKLNKDLNDWLDNWNYDDKKGAFKVKVLLLKLLYTQRDFGSYNDTEAKLRREGLTYTLEASKLDLDHLEANNIPDGGADYYLMNDSEKRHHDVNYYLGNFMILDSEENNKKNNKLLAQAMAYYDKMKTSWLIQDINDMIKDDDYFENGSGGNRVPKEAFFTERSKRLKNCFKSLLEIGLNDDEFEVRF